MCVPTLPKMLRPVTKNTYYFIWSNVCVLMFFSHYVMGWSVVGHTHFLRGSKKFCHVGEDPDNVILITNVFHKGFLWTSLVKQLDPVGPIASRGMSIPEFLRKHITTCNFPGRFRTAVSNYGSAHVHALRMYTNI